jgi:hypothetical protein
MKIICPVCEKVVSGYVPRGGDGSALRPYRHGHCEGRFELVTEIYSGAPNTGSHTDGGYAPANGAFDLPHAIDCVRKRYGLPPAAGKA